MASTITIYSPLGVPIAQLDLPTKRSWVLDDAGRCQFEYPIFNATGTGYSPKLVANIFNYGNLIRVQHVPDQVTNADGSVSTLGILPDWYGMMLTPQIWEPGKITATAFSAEKILAFRSMPVGVPPPSIPAGQQFVSILNYANQLGGLRILPGVVDSGGQHVRFNLSVDALTHIKQLVQLTGGDFDVTGQTGASGVLHLYGNWYARKGINTNYLISNINQQLTQQLYTEQGDFFNTVSVYTDDQTVGTRVLATAINTAGVSQNGVLATNVKYPGTAGAAQGIVQAWANAYLAAHSTPTRTLAPTLLNTGNTFSYLVVGNTMSVNLDSVGFSQGGIGLQANVRVTTVSYDDLSNRAQVAVLIQ